MKGIIKFTDPLFLKIHKKITASEATELIKAGLIDGDYFYPKDVKISLFQEHTDIETFFADWYEFDKFSFTDENVSDSRSLKEFINCFEN